MMSGSVSVGNMGKRGRGGRREGREGGGEGGGRRGEGGRKREIYRCSTCRYVCVALYKNYLVGSSFTGECYPI